MTKKDKKEYINFRRYLLNDGFDMLQYSIYTRLCPSTDVVEKHIKRVQANAPVDGSVRVLTVTNHQFATMKVLVGQKKVNEKRVSKAQLSIF